MNIAKKPTLFLDLESAEKHLADKLATWAMTGPRNQARRLHQIERADARLVDAIASLRPRFAALDAAVRDIKRYRPYPPLSRPR